MFKKLFAIANNGLSHLKFRCLSCEHIGIHMNKEHFWPKWLIEKTRTDRTGVKWVDGKKIPPSRATIPICTRCNNDFGRYLESPTAKIFDDLENERGISDNEAELLVRWLWKFEGLHWNILHPNDRYTRSRTLRNRVLNPIVDIRGDLVLAISLIRKMSDPSRDMPLGIDSYNEKSAIFVAGVFSHIAIMVLLKQFENIVPHFFSKYHLKQNADTSSEAKLFYPSTGFSDEIQAIGVAKQVSEVLSAAHDQFSVKLVTMYGNNAPYA